tara:strand:+ start:1123 stop:1752 length:630 start_codon:yes stop_codon:yes gene_type:complete
LIKSVSKPIVVGVAGGTGAGKSTIVKEILKNLGAEKVSVIQYDSYYKNRPELAFEERSKINFDHPDSLDTNLMVEHLKLLISGKNVEIPVFHHFTKYLRDSNTKKIESRPIIIVEGILVLNDKKLRELMNLKVFIDSPPDLRFIRRLKRDLFENGRSVESVTKQYLATIRPMHEEYVEPSKIHADLNVPEGWSIRQAVDLLISHLQAHQ